MKRIIFSTLFIFLLIPFFLFYPKNTFAAQCKNSPPIPISITPTTGDQNTAYTVTILWENMSAADYAYYKDVDVNIMLTDSNNKPLPSGSDVTDSHTRTSQKNSTHTLNSIFVSSAGDHVLSLHLWPGFINPGCTLEQSSPTITVTGVASSTGEITFSAKEGEVCDPNLPNQCPAETSCQSKTGLATDAFICTKDKSRGILATIKAVFTAVFADKKKILLPCRVIKTTNKIETAEYARDCNSVSTAIGEVNVSSPVAFINYLFTLALSLAGVGTTILIIYSGYKILVSRGDKEKIQGARETITSAVIGLLFIVFSLVIFQVITAGILRIPGFR